MGEFRRTTIDFDHDVTPGTDGKIDEDDDEGLDGQEEEEHEDEGPDEDEDENENGDMDEDGDEEVTPLLPIFSAAHLGNPSSGQSDKAWVLTN